MSIENLSDVDWLDKTVASAGLFDDGRPLYGDKWCKYLSPKHQPGLWQHPTEFAQFLIWMSDKNIKTVCDIGCFFGYGTQIIGTYLRRFNPEAWVLGVDNKVWMNSVMGTPDVFHKGTSYDVGGQSFDLAFIDADHDYDSVKFDYYNMNFGSSCRYIAFHDINDTFIRDHSKLNGGVYKLWSELKTTNKTAEFIRDDSLQYFGIGVIDNNTEV